MDDLDPTSKEAPFGRSKPRSYATGLFCGLDQLGKRLEPRLRRPAATELTSERLSGRLGRPATPMAGTQVVDQVASCLPTGGSGIFDPPSQLIPSIVQEAAGLFEIEFYGDGFAVRSALDLTHGALVRRGTRAPRASRLAPELETVSTSSQGPIAAP